MSHIQLLLVASTLATLIWAPPSLTWFTAKPPAGSLLPLQPRNLLPAALPAFLAKDMPASTLPLLTAFGASHFSQKPEAMQRPTRSCTLCLLPLLSPFNISSSLPPQGLCICRAFAVIRAVKKGSRPSGKNRGTLTEAELLKYFYGVFLPRL